MLLIYLFHCRVFHTEIFEYAKITRWSHIKFGNFAVIEGNQMPLVIFMCLWTGNKRKISRKNSECLFRKWQTTLGDTFFAAHCMWVNRWDHIKCMLAWPCITDLCMDLSWFLGLVWPVWFSRFSRSGLQAVLRFDVWHCTVQGYLLLCVCIESSDKMYVVLYSQ